MKGFRSLFALAAALLLALLALPPTDAAAQWLQPGGDPSLSRNLAPDWGAAYAGSNFMLPKSDPLDPAGTPEPPAGIFPVYSSYFGPTNQTALVRAIAVNADQEIFIAGAVIAFGPGPNLPCANSYNGGAADGVVAKFAANGHTLLYCVYVGTSGYDEINALALDSSGNAYVAGYTNDSFSPGGRADAFVVKISEQGSDLAIAQDYFGSPDTLATGDDRATDIAVAPNGSVVVVGFTDSPNFPKVNALDATLNGTRDGFIRRYNGSFTQVLNSTYAGYGNNTADELRAVDIGPDNNITVAGYTNGFDPLERQHGWAARYNANLNVQVWSEPYIGNYEEVIQDIRVLANGKTWIVGYTNSDDFVTGGGCTSGIDTQYDQTGGSDGFLVRLGTNGLPDGYCSFLGGPGLQNANSVDIAENGDVIVVGSTQPGDILSMSSFMLRLNASNYLTADYSLTYGTAGSPDQAIQVLRPANKGVYVAGTTSGSGFWPLTPDAYQGDPATSGDKGYYTLWFHYEDYAGRLKFPAAAVSTDEAVGTLNLEVQRAFGTAGTVTVDYITSNVTAVAGQDYTVASGTLSFGPNETSRTIPIVIANDGTDEDNETFKVTLSNPTGGAMVGVFAEVVVTITDNDNPPTLSLGNCSATEGGTGYCRFVATLSAPSGKTVTFNTSTANGTTNGAVAPGDYTAHANMPRTIPPNQLSLNIDVPVINDAIVEVTENFRLTASNLANATAGTLSATGTIVDNDTPAPSSNAAFVSQVVPTLMETGKTYPIRITMRNTGTTTWTTAANYRLGSQNPDNNTTWDADGRIALPASVAPNTNVEFVFNVVAPAPGLRNFQWRMVQDGLPQWFGQPTTNVAVVVINDRIYASSFQQP